MVLYPKQLDAIMPLLDGFTPISSVDLQIFHDAVRRLEEVLGAGPATGASNYGPKGGNLSVKDRLDKFLEPYGGLHDIAFVNGSSQIGIFGGQSSTYVGFGKSLTRSSVGLDGYGVLFTTQSPEWDSTLSRWSQSCPANWWVNHARRNDACIIRARDLDGAAILTAYDPLVNWGMLVFGYEAFYP